MTQMKGRIIVVAADTDPIDVKSLTAIGRWEERLLFLTLPLKPMERVFIAVTDISELGFIIASPL